MLNLDRDIGSQSAVQSSKPQPGSNALSSHMAFIFPFLVLISRINVSGCIKFLDTYLAMNYLTFFLSLSLCIHNHVAWPLSKKHVDSFIRDGFLVFENAISENDADQASKGLHESLVHFELILLRFLYPVR
jgi:hypothetical protein